MKFSLFHTIHNTATGGGKLRLIWMKIQAQKLPFHLQPSPGLRISEDVKLAMSMVGRNVIGRGACMQGQVVDARPTGY